MFSQGSAGCLAKAGDDIDDTRWKAGLDDEFSQAQVSQGCLFGWFDNCSTSGSQGWSNLKRNLRQRIVPRDDAADNADRLAANVGEECVAWGKA